MKTKNQAQLVYRDRKAEIRKLLKSIEAGIEKHSTNANQDGINWGHAGDLGSIRETLQEVSDQLHGTGEYAPEPFRGVVYNREGKAVKVVVP
jgi:hypothetical protein